MNNEGINIQGKWYSYDIEETEYCEYDINKESIGIFTHYYGNRGLQEYKIDQDTLYFLQVKFILRVISENQFTITIRGKTDTLTRLPDSIITFNMIDYKDDSIFDVFYDKFSKRAYNFWLTYGYITKEEYEEHFSVPIKNTEETNN